MTYAQSHHKNHLRHSLTPSSESAPFLLFNLMTNGIIHRLHNYPAGPDAPPVLSGTGHPAISHARHYITLLTWALLMHLPYLSLENLPTINTQVLS
jgi:hypothetical protein